MDQGTFILPKEKELARIHQAIEDAIDHSESNIIWVWGESGVGKTLLIENLKQEYIDRGDWFLSAKFEKFDNSPYKTVNEIYQKIIHKCNSDKFLYGQEVRSVLDRSIVQGKSLNQILSKRETSRNREVFKDKVLQSNILRRQLSNFLGGIDRENQIPRLILFLDDIHWADEASVEMMITLKSLIQEKKLKQITLIGTYRSELSLSKKKKELLSINEQGSRVCNIYLEEFSKNEIHKLITLRYNTNDPKVKPLANICWEKTYGNPFYLSNFLNLIERKNLISTNQSNNTFCFKENEVVATPASENVVEFLKNNLSTLPPPYQHTLGVAAILGSKFSKKLILDIIDADPSLDIHFLDRAVKDRYLIYTEDNEELDDQGYLQFTHDKILGACYRLIEKSQRIKIHFSVAQYLTRSYKKNNDDELLFQLVKHFQFSQGEIIKNGWQKKAITYYSIAANLSKEIFAFSTALELYQEAFSLIKKDDVYHHTSQWQKDFYTKYIETAFFCGDYRIVDETITQLEERGATFHDLFKAYEIQIHSDLSHERHEKATSRCLNLLEEHYDIKIPYKRDLNSRKTKILIFWQYIYTLLLSRGASTAFFKKLPNLTNRGDENLMSLFTLTALSIYNVDRAGFFFTISKAIQTIIKKGYSSYAPPFYGAYGLILCQSPKPKLKKGTALGQLTEDIIKNGGDVENPSHAMHVVLGLIKFWNTPIRTTLREIKAYLDRNLNVHSMNASSHLLYSYIIHSYYAGVSLPRIKNEIEGYRSSEIFKAASQKGVANLFLDLVEQVTVNIMDGDFNKATNLSGEFFSEKELKKVHQEDKVLMASIAFFKLQLFCFSGNFDSAWSFAKSLRESEGTLGMLIPQQLFYDTIVYAQKIQAQPDLNFKSYIKIVKKNIAKFKVFEKSCPTNFRHQLLLIKALYAACINKDIDAETLFSKAIETALANKFLHEAALAWKLLALFHRRKGNINLASLAESNSKRIFRKWGFEFTNQGVFLTSEEQSQLSISQEQNRIKELFTLGNIISEWESKKGTLKNIIQVINQITREARQVFILKFEDGWKVIYDSKTTTDSYINKGVSLDSYSDLLHGIIIRCIDTIETIILDDATQDGEFTIRPYIRDNGINSIACIPLITNTEVKGILYLEKKELKNHFSSRQAEQLLSIGKILVEFITASFKSEDIKRQIDDKTFKIKTQRNQIENLNKELNHRQLNNFITLNTFFKKQIERTPKNEPLKEAASRFQALVELYKTFNKKDDLKVDMFEYLGKIVSRVFTFHGLDVAIDLEKIEEGLYLDSRTALHLGYLVCELAINAAKYAYHSNPSPLFNIEIRNSIEDNTYTLIASDNGIGIPINGKHGNGQEIYKWLTESKKLNIINNLANDLNLYTPPTIDLRKGTKYSFQFLKK